MRVFHQVRPRLPEVIEHVAGQGSAKLRIGQGFSHLPRYPRIPLGARLADGTGATHSTAAEIARAAEVVNDPRCVDFRTADQRHRRGRPSVAARTATASAANTSVASNTAGAAIATTACDHVGLVEGQNRSGRRHEPK